MVYTLCEEERESYGPQSPEQIRWVAGDSSRLLLREWISACDDPSGEGKVTENDCVYSCTIEGIVAGIRIKVVAGILERIRSGKCRDRV